MVRYDVIPSDKEGDLAWKRERLAGIPELSLDNREMVMWDVMVNLWRLSETQPSPCAADRAWEEWFRAWEVCFVFAEESMTGRKLVQARSAVICKKYEMSVPHPAATFIANVVSSGIVDNDRLLRGSVPGSAFHAILPKQSLADRIGPPSSVSSVSASSVSSTPARPKPRPTQPPGIPAASFEASTKRGAQDSPPKGTPAPSKKSRRLDTAGVAREDATVDTSELGESEVEGVDLSKVKVREGSAVAGNLGLPIDQVRISLLTWSLANRPF
jgi:hypothetical protein